MKFYTTFGQNHKHPVTGESMKDYWIEVFVPHPVNVITIMHHEFGDNWAMFYKYQEFIKEYYPKGRYCVLGEKTKEDEAEEIIHEIYEQRRNNRKIENAGNNNG